MPGDSAAALTDAEQVTWSRVKEGSGLDQAVGYTPSELSMVAEVRALRLSLRGPEIPPVTQAVRASVCYITDESNDPRMYTVVSLPATGAVRPTESMYVLARHGGGASTVGGREMASGAELPEGDIDLETSPDMSRLSIRQRAVLDAACGGKC